MDILSQMIRFEAGELTHQEIIDLFQRLVTSGKVWGLQGTYQRIAQILIEDGEIVSPKN